MTDNELTRASTLNELADTFERATGKIEDAFAMLREAQAQLQGAFDLGSSYNMMLHPQDMRISDPKRLIEKLNVKAWQCLVQRLELRRMVSVSRWIEIERDISEGKYPPVTRGALHDLFRSVSSALPNMFEEAVQEVFGFLRPRNSKLKTNSQFEVPRKVILEGVIEIWSHAYVSDHYAQRILALDNVFHGLDGKGTVAKTYKGELWAAIDDTPSGEMGETTYFRFKKFKNRNLHLEFKRRDLLQKLNAMAGGKRLKPAA